MEITDNKISNSTLDDTKKLIIIFGIASSMAYLHSLNIIHCNLNPSNIFLDEFLFPKISGLHISKNSAQNPIIGKSDLVRNGTFYGNDYIYSSPELINYNIYSAAGDVYSFGMIVYQLIEEISLAEDELREPIKNFFKNGFQPKFKKSTPESFKKLIEKCFSIDPVKRPTFEEIVYHLKTNPDFITQKVDIKEFHNYIKYIEHSQINVNSKEKFVPINNYMETQDQTFRKIQIDFKKLREMTKIAFTVNIGSFDIHNFEIVKMLGYGAFGKVYQILDKTTSKVYAAKMSKWRIDDCSNDLVINLSREINIFSSLNHLKVCWF